MRMWLHSPEIIERSHDQVLNTYVNHGEVFSF
jgi:hypothetical protein